MKKVISVLMVLGFVWILAVPSWTTQDEKFKSELGDIKDPKEAWSMVVGSWNSAIILFSGLVDVLYEYDTNIKPSIPKKEKQCRQIGEDALYLMVGAIYGHLMTVNNLLFEGKAEITIQSIKDLVATNGPLHKNFKGTLEDVKKAEKAIFSAINLLNTVDDFPIFKLIEKDMEKKKKK